MATTKPKTKAQLQAEAKKAAAKTTAAAKKVAAPVAPVAPVAEAAAPVINLQHLTHIVTATNGPEGFCYSPAEVSAPLAAAGLVEVNDTVQDANGDMATRATAAGITYVASTASPFAGPGTAPAAALAATPAPAWTGNVAVQGAAPQTPQAPAPAARTMTKAPEGGFKVIVGIEPPPLTRSFGERKSVYPFDSMDLNGSFFVVATAERPKPAKSLASTVNSAMARHAVEAGIDPATGKMTFTKTRQFSLRAVPADHTWPDGSRGGAPWGYPGQAGAMVTRTK